MTEIAIIITDGLRELDCFQTLLKPRESIAPYVQSLTGITDAMVQNAPEFDEVAEEIYELVKDKVFVAHNVNFDYSFVKAELEGAGITWQSHRLCTVRMARHFVPGLGRYNLGALCVAMGVQNEAAHRALGDCKATFLIFSKIINDIGFPRLEEFLKKQNRVMNLPSAVSQKKASEIPNQPGVYYFKNSEGKILYIGKAVNLSKRVKGHFIPGNLSARKQAFLREIAEIDFELTGNDLIACILEDVEIRKHRPPHNRAQREIVKLFGIVPFSDGKQTQRLSIEQVRPGDNPAKVFTSKSQAVAWLQKFAARHQVPPSQIGLPSLWSLTTDDLPVVNDLHSIYEKESETLENYVFVGSGRNETETSFVEWIPGRLLRYGFCDNHESLHLDEVLDSGRTVKFSPALEAIMSNAMIQPAKWGMKLKEIKEGRTSDPQ